MDENAHMRKLTSAIFVAIAATLPLTSVATATPAEASGAVQMPLAGELRACDFTFLAYVISRGNGRPFAELSTAGSNTVAANVTMVTGQPDTRYDVRVIQVPRPSQHCAPGDPGIIAGSLQTDAGGNGGVSLRGPIASGATGAWVVVDLPADNAQTPVEFYSTSFVAAI
jgi:hypothetical protein